MWLEQKKGAESSGEAEELGQAMGSGRPQKKL